MTEFYSGDDLSSLPLTKEELALVEIVRDDDERDWNRIVREVADRRASCRERV